MKTIKAFTITTALILLFGVFTNCEKDEDTTPPPSGSNENIPEASFTASPTDGLLPLEVSFTDESDNTPSEWQWDFGDGNTSSVQNPTHTYNEEGTYTVMLVVSNSAGKDTLTKENYITLTGETFGEPCPELPTFTDERDGQTYHTVLIGGQCWMGKNLAYLPEVNDNEQFLDLTTNSLPAYGVYGYDGDDLTEAKERYYYSVYGAFYNWWAAVDACPDGWRLPSEDDWTDLIEYLKSRSEYWCEESEEPWMVAKSIASTTGWTSHTGECAVGNNPESNNATGFTALAAGTRHSGGTFNMMGRETEWYSSTETSNSMCVAYRLTYNHAGIVKHIGFKQDGYSVRCIKE